MTRGDRLAVAGFVCSISVLAVEVLLILIVTVPALNTAGDIVVPLLVVGAILWVTGLLLSIRAGRDAPRHRRLAKAGTTVSVITAALFIAGVVVWLVLVVVWFLNDPFAV